MSTPQTATPTHANQRLDPVLMVRLAIVAVVLVAWEALARSGLLYRDVVPSLTLIGEALWGVIAAKAFYANLGVTALEVGIGLGLGGVAGLAAGLAIGSSRFLARAYEPFLYWLAPTPKIIFFPVMIMLFGVGWQSKSAMAVISCFFPIALSVAAGMRGIDRVLIRVGRSYRRQRVADGVEGLPAGDARADRQRRAARLRRRRDIDAARRDEAIQPGPRLHGDPGLLAVQHADDVCAADHRVRHRHHRELRCWPGSRVPMPCRGARV